VSDSSAVTLKRQQKLDKLQKTTQDLIVAWGLSLLCGLGHLGHVWPAAPGWVHALHNPVLAATMSAAALLGELRVWRSSPLESCPISLPHMLKLYAWPKLHPNCQQLSQQQTSIALAMHTWMVLNDVVCVVLLLLQVPVVTSSAVAGRHCLQGGLT
jgi:hypothetical protein